ncbi:MAG TPA: urate hydroxylase PuuD [Caulobacteraceae bacterium]|nr:urate hydroxylase PuuD [Caulobacteraceae bacterium]
MSGLLLNFRNTVIVSVILALCVAFGFASVHGQMDMQFWEAVLRWLHVFSGILWIGLLYYFNFVQTRKMPDIPAELKPAISKYITPEALFWFRWSALFTWVFGLCLAGLRDHFDQPGYLVNTVSLDLADHFQSPQYALMGLGMWLGTIMFLNVWGVIWPKQKIALGLVEADADKKAAAAKVATLASRINVLLSIPMLVSMTFYQTLNG